MLDRALRELDGELNNRDGVDRHPAQRPRGSARAPVDEPCTFPLSTYRLQLHAGFTFDAATDTRRLSRAARRRRVLYLAVLRRQPRQHPRLRRRQSQRDQPGARRARGSRAIRRHGSPSSASATSSTSSPITWASAPGRTCGGATCSRTAPARRARDSSTSTGRRSRPRSRPSCCCRSSATSTAACSSAASSSSRSSTVLLVVRYFDYELPINPKHAPLVSSPGGRAADERARRRQPGAARVPEHPDVAAEPAGSRRRRREVSSRSVTEDLQRREADRGAPAREGSRARTAVAAGRRMSAGRRADRGRGARGQRRGRPARQLRRAARAARGAGLPPVVLAHGVARDQLPALLRRQRARRPAGRGSSASLPRRTRCSASCCEAGACRPCASITRTGCSIRRAISTMLQDLGSGDLYVARREDPVESTNRCLRAGPSPARPATTISTISTASSSPRRRQADAPRLREAHRADRAVRRRPLREQAADHGDGDGERAERARARARADRRRQPPVARLHARQPARHADRGRRLLPGVSHLRRRDRLDARRSRRCRSGDRARPAAQPGDGVVALRLLPRSHDAAQPRRGAAQRRSRLRSTTAASATRRPTPTKRASGCISR